MSRLVFLFAVALSVISGATQNGVLAEELGFGYERRDGTIHFIGKQALLGSSQIDAPAAETVKGFVRVLSRETKVCKSVDADTFQALSEEYSRDKDHVFYKWVSPGHFLVVELAGADPGTFKPINQNYAVDKNSIWYFDHAIANSDPISARLVDHQIIKDAKHVYVSGVKQPHLNPLTFRKKGSAYFVDLNGVYWGKEPVQGVDQASFRALDNSFAAIDKNHVYLSGKRAPNLDAATCELILFNPYGYQILSDKNGVYVNQLQFLHATQSTFEVIDQTTAKDKDHVYCVDLYHATPLTLYRKDGKLVLETVLYDRMTSAGRATVRADVTPNGLTGLRYSPAPGKKAVQPVPQWQIDLLSREDLRARLIRLGDFLDKSSSPK